MDEKQEKILLVGGALLLGAYVLTRPQVGVASGGVGTAADLLTGLTITQDEPTKKEEVTSGGDVYYNITFPDLRFPGLHGNGGNGGNGLTNILSSGGGITSVKKAAPVSAPLQPLAGISPVFTSVAERVSAVKEKKATKKETTVAKEPGFPWKKHGIKMPFGLPTLYPHKPVHTIV